MLGSGLNLVTTVIGFGMSATFIVFVCARLICGRARAGEASPPSPSPSPPPHAPFDFDIEFPADLDRPIEHHRSGLEPVVVATIPTVKYNCEAFHSKEDAQCSICLGEYKEKEMLRIMPTCHHNFHLACIDVWLQKQSTCPICRISLNEMSEGKSAASPARSIPQTFGRPESSGNRSNQWLLPTHHDHVRGRESSTITHESVNVGIADQQEIQESRTTISL